MTQSSTKTYEFTAFTESDLIDAGATLSAGATFTMPVFATTTFLIEDQDAKLSGAGSSAALGTFAQDGSGQTGTIDGAQTSGQIYAETTWQVMDQDGNWYILIEIEQEGSGDSYFTFYTGHGYSVPPPDTDLTVISSDIALRDTQGNIVPVDYGDLSAGDAPPPTLSGRYFCDENRNDVDDGDPAVAGALVSLVSIDGTVVEQTRTDADGNYAFNDVLAGEYYVQFEGDTGKTFVAPNAGGDSEDSDVITTLDNGDGVTGIYFVEDRFTNFNDVDAGIAYATEAATSETTVDDFVF